MIRRQCNVRLKRESCSMYRVIERDPRSLMEALALPCATISLQSNPRSSLGARRSQRARIAAAVDEQVLAGDVTRVRRAEECDDRAEFLRRAEAPRRHGGLAFRLHHRERYLARLRHLLGGAAQPVRVERSRQDA